LALATGPAAARVKILAAESVYGAVAADVAGPAANVTSVLRTPAQDPHDFEAGPAVARDVADADIVVENGLDYDAWLDRLLAGAPRAGRTVVRVADLTDAAPGANPHLWQAPANMVKVASALADDIAARDAANAPAIRQRTASFMARMARVTATIADMRARFAGTPVAATEPVFGPMAAALGLDMRDARFQLAVMNGTEPRAGDVIAFEDDLLRHRVRLLFHNTQVSDASSDRLLALAAASRVPVVGVAETLPAGEDYPDWMLAELGAVRGALAAAP
jgi:zinc/manganese transport system substrate-binding protein